MSTYASVAEDTGSPGTLVKALRRGNKHLFRAGLLLILTGVVALVFPMASSLAVAIMIGILFLMGGAVMFFASFAFHGAGPFFGSLLIALLTLGCGAF